MCTSLSLVDAFSRSRYVISPLKFALESNANGRRNFSSEFPFVYSPFSFSAFAPLVFPAAATVAQNYPFSYIRALMNNRIKTFITSTTKDTHTHTHTTGGNVCFLLFQTESSKMRRDRVIYFRVYSRSHIQYLAKYLIRSDVTRVRFILKPPTYNETRCSARSGRYS